MDKVMLDYLERRLYGDRAQGNPRNDYAGRDMGYPMRSDMAGQGGDMGYPGDFRQGVKGTGPYGIGGSMYRGDRNMDRNDYAGDMRNNDFSDYGRVKMPKLTKAEKHQWKMKLRNTDGTQGEHYDMQQIMQVAEQMGMRFTHIDEHDLCLIVNWLYSDYGQVFKKHLPAEKMLVILVEMAKAYFDDPDGPEPDEKMSRQYHCMVNYDW